MSFVYLAGYTSKERDEVRAFWANRYHDQAIDPVPMSPSRQNEGGYGLWDAAVHADNLRSQSRNNPALARSLDLMKDAPESTAHPVTAAYTKRREAMMEQRRVSCGADRDRLDLMVNAEAKAHQAWVKHEHFGHRKNESPARAMLDNADREKAKAFNDLFQYDKRHGHPLTDPNRNLRTNPPDVAERRQWMVERAAVVKNGTQPKARQFDPNNDREMAGLGMMPKNWMDPKQLRDADRKAPPHSGKLIPSHLEARHEQRREIDRLTGTKRSLNGEVIGPDWAANVRAISSGQKLEAQKSFREEQVAIAKRSTRQGTESVADTRTISDRNAITAQPGALAEKLAARRDVAIQQAPKEERRPTLGQQIYQDRLLREAGNAQSRGEVKMKPLVNVREAAPPVSKDRQHAEAVARRYERITDRTQSVRHAKMTSPDHVQKVLHARKHTPRISPAARREAERPVQAKPQSPQWFAGLQTRVSSFKKEVGNRWQAQVRRMPWMEQARANRAQPQRTVARSNKPTQQPVRTTSPSPRPMPRPGASSQVARASAGPVRASVERSTQPELSAMGKQCAAKMQRPMGNPNAPARTQSASLAQFRAQQAAPKQEQAKPLVEKPKMTRPMPAPTSQPLTQTVRSIPVKDVARTVSRSR